MSDATTTGSIDAKLGIDKSAWDRGFREVKVEATELGALNPEVKVTADVASALTKIDAVALAQRKLDDAYARSAIAQERLSVVTKKYGEDSLQAAQARLTLKKASDAESDAEIKLTGLRSASTVETDKNTSALSRLNSKISESTDNLKNFGGRWQALVALSPAIVGAMAPVGAAAVGLVGAFGGMAAAGVLAIVGIKKEMQSGTAVGNSYATGLGTLKGALDTLSRTSAVSMLGAFNRASQTISSNLPALNTQIGMFSGLLGNIGATGLDGLITGFRVANPLFVAGGLAIQNLVADLAGFAASDGFSQFVTYAVGQLPSVMNLLEQAGTLVFHLVEAFAPLGQVTISVLGGLVSMLNGLPLPILAGLVTMVTSLGVAFKIAPAIVAFGQALGLISAEAQLAVPVVGVLLAAMTGIAAVALSSAAATNTQTDATNSGAQAQQDYSNALLQSNGALDQNIRQMAAKKLQDAGVGDAAKTLGISLGDVTSAVLGQGPALDTVNAKFKAVSAAFADALVSGKPIPDNIMDQVHAMQQLGPAIGVQTDALKGAVAGQNQLNEFTAAGTTGVNAQGMAVSDLAAKYGTSVAAYQSASAAQASAKQSTDDQTLAMKLQSDAAGLLKGTLDALNGKALDAAQAQNAFDSSLTNMGTHVNATGKKITFTTTSIKDMSSASVALRGQLNGQVSNLQNVIAANGGLTNSTAKAKAQMATMRTQIIENAVAHGVDRAAVTAYVDSILKIPKKVPPTKVDIDKAAAVLKLQGFQQAINSLTGKTVTIYADANIAAAQAKLDNLRANSMIQANAYATGSAYRKADGGEVPGYANGGSVADYRAIGGFPGGPKGTDTVPTWLTPREFVVKRSSAAAIGKPALDYMNQTGQLPPGGQTSQAGPITVQLVLDGKIIDSRIVNISEVQANAAISRANDYAGRRPAR